MSEISVLLADDHSLVRAGICSLLERLEGVNVVAEADDGRAALSLVRTHHPDVVVTDIAMPGMNGLETVARIKKEFPGIHIIILSMHANEEYVLQALRAGASGYLLKNSAIQELEIALKAAMNDHVYLSPPLSKQVLEDYIHRCGELHTESNLLTPRQREILQLIAEGRSTKQIAQLLEVSAKTVETHRKQLMERLDLHDVAGLVRYAVRTGLVTTDH